MRARGPRGEPGGPPGSPGNSFPGSPLGPLALMGAPLFFRKTHISHLAVPLLEDQR